MLRNDPLWFKDAVIYQLHVRAYHDSVGDGTGDFRGLAQKLDYLQDLGVTAIWLLPFYPSPLRDDGYDIADYTDVHPDYGTLETFREFLDAAHARGLRVITELVVNHTSDQHAWFQRARRSPPGSVERDFYVWSDTPEKYREARIIFKDFETSNWTYDNLAKAYYWHRFYSHQPDLNFDNPEVWKALFPVLDFWMEMGVDGLRLDAVPYLYEREGTNCENLPETHLFLQALRRHVDEKHPGRMLLAEANQWPEDAAAYFGEGNECHMAFHFPVMPRLFMAMHTEDRFPLVDILQQTPAIPENCQWAIFLRNHDELTLEMVTDEERDYMYRAYASEGRARINLGIRRRLAPLLGNNRRRIELMNGLLFSLPGTPVIYYGDEIGMGDNIYLGDRNSVRTPMQWSADRNAGFSRSNPQKLFLPINIDPEYHYEAVNVEAQQGNPNSLLWWMKRLIGLREQQTAFSRGTIEFLDPPNRKILAFLRKGGDESLLVVANLSRFVQYVELDLSRFDGMAPREMFGSTAFPRIGKQPYVLTLGPHAFYWFALGPQPSAARAEAPPTDSEVPTLPALSNWEQLFDRVHSPLLRVVLQSFLSRTGGLGRMLRAVRIRDCFRLTRGETVTRLLVLDLEFNEGIPEVRVVRLAFAPAELAEAWTAGDAPPVVAKIPGNHAGLVYSAMGDPARCRAVLAAMAGRQVARSESGGELAAWSISGEAAEITRLLEELPVTVGSSDQRNQRIVFGNRWIVKSFERVEEGRHPEVEIGRLLSDGQERRLTPRLLGWIDYRRRQAEPMTLAVLHEFVPNEGDAWQYTLDVLGSYFEWMAATPQAAPDLSSTAALSPADALPPHAPAVIGHYLEMIRRLGERLGELHLALAGSRSHPDFTPEPFSRAYQRSLYQSMRQTVLDVLARLRRCTADLPDEVRSAVEKVDASESLILQKLRPLLERGFQSMRIRCHGDFHLAHALSTGKDFLFIDFEGVPSHSLGERRIKRSPLRDVVTLLRSVDYAVQSSLLGLATRRGQTPGTVRAFDRAALQPWGEFWRRCVNRAFLAGYESTPSIGDLVPPDEADRALLLDILGIERLLTEIGHELRHDAKLLPIPLTGLLRELA